MTTEATKPEAASSTAGDVIQIRLAQADEAIDRCAWGDAVTVLRDLDAANQLDAAHVDTLAEAEWWIGNLEAAIEARERAYQAWLAADEPLRAARTALELAQLNRSKLSMAATRGWRKRAGRLLKDQPESVVHGYQLLFDLRGLFHAETPDEAIAAAERAAELGARFGDRNLEVMAQAELGRMLIHAGRLDEGSELEEEACAAALGGELGPKATAITFCSAISTSKELTDYDRAGELSDAAKRWCERQAIEGFPGVCRVYRAEVMRVHGKWADAEREIRRACDELRTFSPDVAGEAFRELGELRFRAGDLGGAEEAFTVAQELGHHSQPGQARLLLATGKPRIALHELEAEVDKPHVSVLDRAHYQPLLVEAAIEAGEVENAIETARQLAETAARYDTPVLRASSTWANALVAAASGDTEEGRRLLRRSIAQYEAADMPYEAATGRLRLGRLMRELGDEEIAAVELAAAQRTFERLGARRDAEIASAERAGGGGAVDAPADLKTFMFTDVVGSTQLIEAIGDAAWTQLVAWHDRTLRALFAEHGGEELNQAGDGFFVGFADPAAAVRCAVAIQRALAEHRRTSGFAPEVRIGLHRADAKRSKGVYRGRGVHAAARIGALADGGEILASLDTLAGVPDVEAGDERTVELRGLAEPVRVASVRWR